MPKASGTPCFTIMPDFSPLSLQVAMNELDNHDHSRFLTRTNGRVGPGGAAGTPGGGGECEQGRSPGSCGDADDMARRADPVLRGRGGSLRL